MKVDLSKKYRTAEGHEVKLYDILEPTQKHNVVGALKHECGTWKPALWDAAGINGTSLVYNLVEIPDFEIVANNTGRFFEYFGISIRISEEIKWIATDQNGTVYGYNLEPFMLPYRPYWETHGKAARLKHVEFRGDFKQSKIQVC